jgi:hypothetical protein
LLLVEPDFRLRSERGQVRVQLRGPSAVAVARTHITSGDEVILSLEGAKWAEATPGISTPGKSVESELVYTRRLILQVYTPEIGSGRFALTPRRFTAKEK